MSEPFLRLLCGHVLDVLRQLPERSVHCVVTSPPYLWLRDYGTEPQVWGGERGCEHAWGDALPAPRRGPGNTVESAMRSSGLTNPAYHATKPNKPAGAGVSCLHCDAWRGSLGLEPTVELYVEHVVEVFREVWRVLRDDGTLWLNLGDCFASTGGHTDTACNDRRGRYNIGTRPEHEHRTGGNGLKPKDLVGVPWRVALALQVDGWYLRRDIVWAKLNPMPESVTDRPSTAHEFVFLLTKRATYFYDADAVRERAAYLAPNAPDKIKSPHGQGFTQRASGAAATFKRENSKRVAAQVGQRHGTHRPDREAVEYNGPARNLRSVWSLASSPFPEAHFATYPVEIPITAIKAGTSERGCCPSCGAPWRRVADVEYGNPGNRSTNGPRSTARKHLAHGTAGYAVRKERRSTTTGWRPTCSCPPAEPIPCTVLDPFNGAGTSGLAAARLGRTYIGIDLNPEYCEMARRRIEGDAPLLNAVAEEPDPQVSLFTEQL